MQYDFSKMQQRAKAKEAKECFLNIQSQEQEYSKEFDLCLQQAEKHGIDTKICNKWKTIKIKTLC